MRSTIPRAGAALATLALVLAACGGTSSQSPGGSGAASQGTGEVVDIHWFCCLGTGDDPQQVPTEQQVVADFNASHPNINLILEIVDYDSAFDAMSVEIAGGNAPDIVGPMGVSGAEAFHGKWLDLSDLIESNGYDLSQFTTGSVEFYNVGGEGQIGLPFAIYPSMLYYQRDMFDEAGLDYPPHAYGDPYTLDGEEVEWNMDTLRELAMRLTVDVNGNDATSASFDPENIVQFGYEPQYQDLRAAGSYFGSGSLVADDGTTAQIPDTWADAWKWIYNGIWEDHFIMNEALETAPEFGNGNPYQSGHVAMALTHLWYTCCVSPQDDEGNPIGEPNWDLAAVPSYQGETTSNFNADTFRIWTDTEHPQESFEVLTYLLGDASETLLGLYGGMPARSTDQDQFFTNLDDKWTQGVDWEVAKESVAYADNPSFEGYTPAYQETFDAIVAELSKLRSTEGLDMDDEIASFKEQLQGIYDGAQ
jgi:multiple sugar transport system substrate-binding protein